MRYKNCVSGVEGQFLCKVVGYYGEMIIVMTDDKREYYAPIAEWHPMPEFPTDISSQNIINQNTPAV